MLAAMALGLLVASAPDAGAQPAGPQPRDRGRAAASAGEPRLTVQGEAETVYRWAQQRCDVLNVPDSPARALRNPDGSLALMAAHYTNVVLLGRDFRTLAPACNSASRGSENREPGEFDDRFWVQAVVPLPDGRVLGLASHEYMGKRHEGMCSVTTGPGWARCWYSAITATVAEPGRWQFRPLPLPARVVAASSEPYRGNATSRTGFFSVTNIVRDGDYAYTLVYTEGVPGQPRGMCLLRAPMSDLVTGWRALSGDGEFRVNLGVDGHSSEPCRPVQTTGVDGAVRSVVRVGRDGPWVATFIGRAPDANSGRPAEGVFTSVSSDLQRWSRPRLLLPVAHFRSQREPGLYYTYPSLIDHGSSSPIFDVADGGQLHLYLTRLNLAEDRRAGMNRDLVRYSVRVEP
jgi:hypothetical protein